MEGKHFQHLEMWWVQNLILTAVNWTKTRAARLASKWKSGERRSARRHANWSSELLDEIFALFVYYIHHDKPFGLGGGGLTDEVDV
jgi:hypothetical protein